jgi:hypothetical protein
VLGAVGFGLSSYPNGRTLVSDAATRAYVRGYRLAGVDHPGVRWRWSECIFGFRQFGTFGDEEEMLRAHAAACVALQEQLREEARDRWLIPLEVSESSDEPSSAQTLELVAGAIESLLSDQLTSALEVGCAMHGLDDASGTVLTEMLTPVALGTFARSIHADAIRALARVFPPNLPEEHALPPLPRSAGTRAGAGLVAGWAAACEWLAGRRKQVHVSAVMPARVQRWLLGAELLRARPELAATIDATDDASPKPAQASDVPSTPRRSSTSSQSAGTDDGGDGTLRRHDVLGPAVDAHTLAQALPNPPAHQPKREWQVSELERVPGGQQPFASIERVPCDQAAVHGLVAAAIAPELPLAESEAALRTLDGRERRRSSCAPGGDAGLFLLALSQLARTELLAREGELDTPAAGRAEAAAALPPPLDGRRPAATAAGTAAGLERAGTPISLTGTARAESEASETTGLEVLRQRALLARTAGALELTRERIRRLLVERLGEASICRFCLATDTIALGWLREQLSDQMSGRVEPLDLRDPELEQRELLRRLLRYPRAHGCATLRSVVADPEGHGLSHALVFTFLDALLDVLWGGGAAARKIELATLDGPRGSEGAVLHVLGPPLAPCVCVGGAPGGAGEAQWASSIVVHPLRQRACCDDLARFFVERQSIVALHPRASAAELSEALEQQAQRTLACVLVDLAPGLPVFEVRAVEPMVTEGDSVARSVEQAPAAPPGATSSWHAASNATHTDRI